MTGRMKLRRLLLTLALLSPLPAFADEPPEDLGIRGEYVRAGTGFACKVTPNQPIAPEIQAKLSDQACLHLGSLAIWADEKTLEPRFGKPDRTLDQDGGATANVYFIGKQEGASYFVITLREHRVVSIQLSGKQSVDGYEFDHVKLGTSAAKVLELLGQPMLAEPVADVPGAELWSYTPWTFSLEVTQGRVTSIRIADPSAF